jgi:hypothetical protein
MVLLGWLFTPAAANAEILTLQHGNSIVTLETGPVADAGIIGWVDGGFDHLTLEWFFTATLPSLEPRRLGGPGFFLESVSSPAPNKAMLTYDAPEAGGSLRYDLSLELIDDPLGVTSTLLESVRITNNTPFDLPLRFYQYSDFDLAGSSNDFLVRFTKGKVNEVRQYDTLAALSGFGWRVSSTVDPFPTHREVDLFRNTLDRLEKGPYTLNDFPPEISNGDLTWAF